ncbi:MAG: hypothetical protein DCC52_11035, partial [Chloroflexi bacterium]
MPRRANPPSDAPAARKKPSPPPQNDGSRFRLNLSAQRKRELGALLLIAAGILTLLSLFGFAGSISALWATFLTRFAGYGAYALAALAIYAGIGLFRRQENVFGDFETPWGRIVAFEIIFMAGCGLLSLAMAADDRDAMRLADNGMAGGYLGLAVATLLTRAFSIVLDLGLAVATLLTRAFSIVLDPNWAAALAALVLCLLILFMLRFAFDLTALSAFVARTLENLRPTPAAASAAPARFAPPPPAHNLAPNRPLVQLPLPKQASPDDAAAVEDAEITEPPEPKPAARLPFLNLGRKTEKTKTPPPTPTLDPLLAVPYAQASARTGHN